jgi:amino acid transporter
VENSNLAAPGEIAANPPPEASSPALKAGALGLPEVIMQAVSHIGPAAGTLTALAFITSLTGIATPITFVFGGAVCLLIAIALTQLAKKIHGAGGYFTYVAQTVGPRAGFMTAWLYFLYDPLITGALFSWGGGVIEAAMKQRWGWGIPWWAFSIGGIAFVGALSWRGVKISAKFLVFAGIAEMVIFIALGVTGLVDPGPGGVSLAPFNPAEAPDFNAIYLGVVFTVLTFTGFESVAPLAEETRNPRRNLPIAIVVSVVLLIMYHAITSWGILTGWGIKDLANFGGSSAPVFEFAENAWGQLWFLVLLALLNSTIAVTMATHNAATRVFYAMGRTGVLPRGLAKVHPVNGTPVNAILLQTVISLLGALGLGVILGAEENFFFVGVVVTLGLVVVYSMGNLGIFRIYTRQYRKEFNPLLHLIIPLVSTLILIWVAYKSIEGLNFTDPQEYLDWTPIVTVGWFLIGLLVLLAFRLRGNEGWLLAATEKVAVEEEHQHDGGIGIGAPPRDDEGEMINAPPREI